MKDYIRKNSTDKSVYQAIKEKDGNISVFPQGGGMSRLMTEAEFKKTFMEQIGLFPIRHATVTADFLPENMVLDCIGSDRRWNGWGMPMFERAVIDSLIPIIKNDDGDQILSWDGETLLIKSYGFDSEMPESEHNYKFERYEKISANIDDEILTVWEVGNGWTWDALTFKALKSH